VDTLVDHQGQKTRASMQSSSRYVGIGTREQDFAGAARTIRRTSSALTVRQVTMVAEYYFSFINSKPRECQTSFFH